MSGTFSIARNYVKTNLPMRKVKDDSFGRQKMMKMNISAVCTLNLKGLHKLDIFDYFLNKFNLRRTRD